MIQKIPSIQVFACDHQTVDIWKLPFIRIGTGYHNNSAIKDNIEENILQNYDQLLSEGTSIWWLWKHLPDFGNPDYVGFCHYRRFFTLLKPNFGAFPIFSNSFANFDKLTDYIITPAQQLAIIQQNNADGILPLPFPDYGYANSCNTIQDLMKAESDKDDMQLNMPKHLCDKAFDILLENTPSNLKSKMQNTFSDLNGYHFNIFTLKRELFDLYSQIIWKSCFDIEKYAHDEKIENLHPRWLAYLLERYSSCIFKMMQLNNQKFIELPMMMLNKIKYK